MEEIEFHIESLIQGSVRTEKNLSCPAAEAPGIFDPAAAGDGVP